MLIDTHCHIHDKDYPLDANEVIERAHQAGVKQMICIGTSIPDSIQAVSFANGHEGVFASIGVHPHEQLNRITDLKEILASDQYQKIVAIGEIGLDYHYLYQSREIQIKQLESQIDLAVCHNLPIVFHVRDAYEDFWSIIDNFRGLRAVIHSFTDYSNNSEEALRRGFYIGVNGFCTFTKEVEQQRLFASLPLDRIVLETDAPYLTPVPFRGKINEPALVGKVAEFLSNKHGISFEEIADKTTSNARVLFNI